MTDRDPEPNWPPRREDFETDLEGHLDDRERESLSELAVRITEQRPVPSPGWRSAMRARLLGGSTAPRSRVAAMVFGYAASGAVLLAVAAIGLLGAGPFAA
jgi:hypothetical protein